MPLPSILDKQKDMQPYFGVDCDNENARLLWLMQRAVESAARKFVRHGIAQATYTEFQRKFDVGISDSHGAGSSQFELIGNKVYNVQPTQTQSEYLQLDNGFVRSVANVWEDYDARFGQQSGDFSSDDLLVEGEDYYIELDESGLGKSGRLIRVNRSWSTKPGTIKIEYTAGFAPSELDDEYLFVKLALLEEIADRFNDAKAQRQGAFGPVKKETIFGDVQREFAVSTKTETRTQLSHKTMSALQPLKAIIP